MRTWLRNAIAWSGLLLAAACNSNPPLPVAPVAESDGHGHAHEHGHSHEQAGPHGGHLIELGDEAYHLEWTHDDELGMVTLYVLDAAAEQLVPISAEKITITAKVEETVSYELAAVEPSGDPPATAQFQLKSPELLVSLQLAGQGTDVSVTLPINGQDYEAKFEHHDHGHGHQH